MTGTVEPWPELASKSLQRGGRKPDPLSSEKAKRQGLIVHLAFGVLGGRDQAIKFLNACDDELGGRPIDLAIENVDGYQRVESAIRKKGKSSDRISDVG